MIKKQFYMGFAGFIGFIGIRFFFTGNIIDLMPIGFFGYFAHFFIAKLSGDNADERYLEDKKTALAFTGQIATLELFILMCLGMLLKNHEIVLVLISVCFAVTLLSYAIKLYMLEEK